MEDNTSNKSNGLLIGLIVVAVIVVVGFLVMRGAGKSGSAVQPGVVSTPAVDQPEVDNDVSEDVQTITVDAKEFSFTPSTLVLVAGQPVRIVLTNSGSMQHDFVIDELGVKSRIISGGQSDTIDFTPTKAGTYSFYCSVGNHKSQGMVGSLTVQ